MKRAHYLNSEEIDKRRIRMGLSAGGLAKRAEVSRGSLSKAMNHKPVGMKVALRISTALGVNVKTILRDPAVKAETSEAQSNLDILNGNPT